jgi:hypothetical protein
MTLHWSFIQISSHHDDPSVQSAALQPKSVAVVVVFGYDGKFNNNSSPPVKHKANLRPRCGLSRRRPTYDATPGTWFAAVTRPSERGQLLLINTVVVVVDTDWHLRISKTTSGVGGDDGDDTFFVSRRPGYIRHGRSIYRLSWTHRRNSKANDDR